MRTAILYSSTEADAVATAADGDNNKPRQQFKDVDVMKRGVGERVFRVAEEDNQRFLQKLRNRIDRYAPTLTGDRPGPLLFPFCLVLR